MNQQQMEAIAKEVFSDKEYVKGLLELGTAEEVQASLKEKGLEFSIDEIMHLKKAVEKSQTEELTDEDLEEVSGGCGLGLAAVIASCVCGVLGVGAIAMDATRTRW